MPRSRPNGGASRTQRCLPIFFVVGICCGFFEFGAWQMGGIKGDNLAKIVNSIANCSIKPDLYETHRRKWGIFKPCDSIYTDYTPCHDQRNRTVMFLTEKNMEYHERHCPSSSDKKLNCLIPAPLGYVTPFSWPKSRDFVPKTNVQFKNLTLQNWILLEGNVFKFTGGRGTTMFPQGVDAYIEQLASVIPIADGTVRNALDINCGVADWGAYLLKRNVVAMSFAPRYSNDEAKVQFALERGVPAVIGVLGTKKLPYPSASFDMAHCSRCLIPWTSNDGMCMVEVDRVLRPGGYWILSGPPINWESYDNNNNNKTLEQKLKNEHRKIEEYAELLCWEKLYEKSDIAIWRKKMNTSSCRNREYGHSIRSCDSRETDDVWYRNMSTCITLWTEASQKQLNKFPERLFSAPPRITSGYVLGVTEKTFRDDNILWKKHIQTYKKINTFFGTVRYRNIMDMNAGLGGFAAAIESPNSWVMNVVPTISQKDTLGVIYERGLIGIYHDWCEAFSTYPRTYDFIHAEDIFSLYNDRCEMEDILVEMDRILRPEGAVIIRDSIAVLNKVLRVARGIRWNVRIMGGDNGGPDKIIVAVKRYWVGTWK